MASSAESLPAAPSDRRPLVPWSLGTGVLVLVLTQIIYFIGASAFFTLTGRFYYRDRIGFLLIQYQFLALGVAAVVIALVLARFNVRSTVLGFRFPGWEMLGAAVLTALVTASVGIALLYAAFSTFFPSYHLQGNTQSLLGAPHHLPLIRYVLMMLVFAVEAPLVEETLFRGVLYQGFRHFFGRWIPYGWAVFAGAVLSGLVFGAIHGEPRSFPILAFLGIILAYVFQYTRSLYASALVHAIINGLAVTALYTGK